MKKMKKENIELNCICLNDTSYIVSWVPIE